MPTFAALEAAWLDPPDWLDEEDAQADAQAREEEYHEREYRRNPDKEPA